jgi:hypothetical protein
MALRAVSVSDCVEKPVDPDLIERSAPARRGGVAILASTCSKGGPQVRPFVLDGRPSLEVTPGRDAEEESMARPECVFEAKDSLGEGPCWHPRERALYWTDVPSKKIKRWNPASGAHASWTLPEMVTAISVRGKGGLIIASHTGIDFFDPASGGTTRFCAPEKDKPKNRSNDGKCDRQGRFWYGTRMNNSAADMSEQPITGNTGGLYRIDPDGTVHSVRAGTRISLYLAWVRTTGRCISRIPSMPLRATSMPPRAV